MIKYIKRDELNGGDFWEVDGNYYSHPVGAALKLCHLNIAPEVMYSSFLRDNTTEALRLCLNTLKMLPEASYGKFNKKQCIKESTISKIIGYGLKKY